MVSTAQQTWHKKKQLDLGLSLASPLGFGLLEVQCWILDHPLFLSPTLYFWKYLLLLIIIHHFFFFQSASNATTVHIRFPFTLSLSLSLPGFSFVTNHASFPACSAPALLFNYNTHPPFYHLLFFSPPKSTPYHFSFIKIRFLSGISFQVLFFNISPPWVFDFLSLWPTCYLLGCHCHCIFCSNLDFVIGFFLCCSGIVCLCTLSLLSVQKQVWNLLLLWVCSR